jgi:hypothetical protein
MCFFKAVLLKQRPVELAGGLFNTLRFIPLYTNGSADCANGWFMHDTPFFSADYQTLLEQCLQQGYHESQGKDAHHSCDGKEHRGKGKYPITGPHDAGEHQDPDTEQQTGPADQIQKKLQQLDEILGYGKETAEQIYEKEKYVQKQRVGMHPAGERQQSSCLQHDQRIPSTVACLQPGS